MPVKKREEVGEGTMPLSWLWLEKDYSLENKLHEIEHTLYDFYDYGKAEMHAGPIKESIRKEIDRLHRLSEIDDKLEQIGKRIGER